MEHADQTKNEDMLGPTAHYEYGNAENGAKSTLTAIMGRMATYSGKTISWDEALNSDHHLMPAQVDWNTTPPSLPDENGHYTIPTPGVTKF